METTLNLPVEMLSVIISWLDPVTLISLSQSSQLLRRLVNPTQHDFERRLLALELTPEFGGIIPEINDSHLGRVITPPREHEEWKNNKYACLGCMKLLPHYMFSDSGILSLEYAKPLPGTAEAQKSQVTDWQPLSTGRKRKRIIDEHEAQRMKRLRLMQPRITSGDRLSAEARTEFAGMWRHKRRCHECRYQTKRNRNAKISTSRVLTVPIGKIRCMEDLSCLERYFPGLLDLSAMECTPETRNVAMARCPGCETWQEYRAFGANLFLMTLCRIPPNWVCYTCYIATALKGQPPCYVAEKLCRPVLEDLLAPWGDDLTDFFDGWSMIQTHAGPGEILEHRGFFYRDDWLRALVLLRHHRRQRVVTVELLQTLRPLFDEYKSALDDRPATVPSDENNNWIAANDELERRIYSMLEQTEILRKVCDQKPQFILDYFMKQDDPFYSGTQYTILEEFQLMEDGTVVRRVNGRF